MKIDLAKLGYKEEWIKYKFITKEQLNDQNLVLENGVDKNIEHYRHKSFLNWIELNVEKKQVKVTLR